MKTIVSVLPGREMRLFNTGQTWRLPTADVEARFGSPFWSVHRGDLHQALAAALEQRGGNHPYRLSLFRFRAEYG
jgi:salicylate hydroxylase